MKHTVNQSKQPSQKSARSHLGSSYELQLASVCLVWAWGFACPCHRVKDHSLSTKDF